MTERRIPFLDLAHANAPLMQEIEEATASVIRSGRYLLGAETAALEEEMARLCGKKGAVATSNGLDSLRLIVRAWIDFGLLHEGDFVIVPANTYIASAIPLSEFGLKILPVDPSVDTFNLTAERIRRALTEKVKAVMLVHLYGTPAATPAYAEELRSEGILVIEDCAQAIGASANEMMVGGWGDAAAFSFYPTKNVGALGDAGAVVSDNEEMLAHIRVLANYGSDCRYHNVVKGYNCRIDEIQAAIIRVKLRYLDQEISRRRRVADAYFKTINHPEIALPGRLPITTQVWHQFPILTPRRDALRLYLDEKGIGTDVHYPTPFYRQPCYDGTFNGAWPVTDRICREIVSIPIGSICSETAEEIGHIINQF